MTQASNRLAGGTRGAIPYVDRALERPVIRFDQRDYSGMLDVREVEVGSGRAIPGGPRLEREGFTLVDWPSQVVRERREELIRENAGPRDDMAPVNQAYLDELQPLMESLSDAREIFPQFDIVTVRFSNKAVRRSWMPTAAFAHFDFEKSSIDDLLQHTLQLTGRTVKPFSRVVMLQTWRVITEPPQDIPLALCDGQSIAPEDIVDMDFFGPPGTRMEYLKSRAARYSPAHRWYYFPDMTPDEVLVFKGFDSDDPDAGNALHTAFEDPRAGEAVPRGSMECRFIALYD